MLDTQTTHTLDIPNYRPPKANDLFRARMRKRMGLENECKSFVKHYGQHIPRATSKRRVSMAVTLAVRQRLPDADEECLKAVLDALVYHGLLLGDRRQWCEVEPTVFVLTKLMQPRTVITLTDLLEEQPHG